VANATSTSAPSEGLRESITALAVEGLDLAQRLAGFLASVRAVEQAFDAEVRTLADEDDRYQAAASESGLGGVHALEEHMLDMLLDVLWLRLACVEQPDPIGEAA
jgi:hypothetical protein